MDGDQLSASNICPISATSASLLVDGQRLKVAENEFLFTPVCIDRCSHVHVQVNIEKISGNSTKTTILNILNKLDLERTASTLPGCSIMSD